MNDLNNPAEPFAGGDGSDPSDGNANVADSNNLSLKELNALLGKDFKDKTTALNSLKETQNYAAQNATKVADLTKKLETSSTDSQRIAQIETELFYSNNPQYKPYRETISAMGTNPAEIVQKDAFKKIFTDLSEFEKTKSAKSVLESNPRIGQAKTKRDESRDLEARGKHSEAVSAAVGAVLDLVES